MKIGSRLFQQYFNYHQTLTAYPNFPIKLLSIPNADVKLDKSTKQLINAETKDDATQLFGKDWIAVFNLHP